MLITKKLDEEENLKEIIQRTQLVVESSNLGKVNGYDSNIMLHI